MNPHNEYKLSEAYDDFILSRKAKRCSSSTIEFYSYTAGRYIDFLLSNDCTHTSDITPRTVRAYLAQFSNNKDSYAHSQARAIKTLLRFFHKEGYIDSQITVELPEIRDKELRVLSPEEVRTALRACERLRDRIIVLLLVDTGLRRSEASKLVWDDINLETGLIKVRNGKGRKSRNVVIGLNTKRLLLKYRRSVPHEENDSVIQTLNNKRLTPKGLRSVLYRLSKSTGIHITPHSLRRTFATLSLRNGMDLINLSNLMGHSSLEMTEQYIRLIDEDLLQAHSNYGPVDNLF